MPPHFLGALARLPSPGDDGPGREAEAPGAVKSGQVRCRATLLQHAARDVFELLGREFGIDRQGRSRAGGFLRVRQIAPAISERLETGPAGATTPVVDLAADAARGEVLTQALAVPRAGGVFGAIA